MHSIAGFCYGDSDTLLLKTGNVDISGFITSSRCPGNLKEASGNSPRYP